MSYIEMGNPKKAEETMRRTWNEFQNALANGKLKSTDTIAALEYKFLKVFNDIFVVNNGQHYCKRQFDEYKEKGQIFMRCVRIEDIYSVPSYERFFPKKEYINSHNRFSPPGVEWLYLSWSDNLEKAKECAKAECRIESGDKMAFCQFEVVNKKAKIFDLTIANHHTYESINDIMDKFVNTTAHNVVEIANEIGIIPERDDIKVTIDVPVKEMSRMWIVFTYIRMLSKEIFVPVNDDKEYMYAPFQCMAYYFQSLGYDGISYSSTVSSQGDNLVLFNKDFAKPIGTVSTEICQ